VDKKIERLNVEFAGLAVLQFYKAPVAAQKSENKREYAAEVARKEREITTMKLARFLCDAPITAVRS
jgi:hypothetical protein